MKKIIDNKLYDTTDEDNFIVASVEFQWLTIDFDLFDNAIQKA